MRGFSVMKDKQNTNHSKTCGCKDCTNAEIVRDLKYIVFASHRGYMEEPVSFDSIDEALKYCKVGSGLNDVHIVHGNILMKRFNSSQMSDDNNPSSKDEESERPEPMNKSFIENKKEEFENKWDNEEFMIYDSGDFYEDGGKVWNFITQTLKEFSDELRLEKALWDSDKGYIHKGKVIFTGQGNGYNQAVSDLNEKIDSLLGGEK